ncbi:MAG TPA: hypothetical protein VLZ55_01555, partial [Rhodanobacter sp.]|nr:hypothetical protein [Rhodanobacter sp.]
MSNLEQVFASAMRRVFAAAETMVKVPVENAVPLDHLSAGVGRPTPESLPPITLLRSSDLLDVTFRFVNLALITDGAPHLVRDKAASPAFLIAVFGPQHLLEQAFFDDAGGDMQASPATGTTPPIGPPAPSAASEARIYPVKAIL